MVYLAIESIIIGLLQELCWLIITKSKIINTDLGANKNRATLMPKPLIVVIFLFLASTLSLSDSASGESFTNLKHLEKEEKKTIYLATFEAPPFISHSLQYSGVLPKITTEAYKLEGYKVVYDFVPIKRSFINTIKGFYDGVVAGQKTPDRAKNFNFGDPILREEIVFFHRKDFKFNWNTINDIKGLIVGSRIGVTGYGQEFWNAAKNNLFSIEYNTETHNSFKQLLAGRIDILPTQKHVGFAALNNYFTKEGAAKITYSKKPLNTADYYILFSKKGKHGQEIIDAFNSGLRKLKASGQYDKWLDEALSPVSNKYFNTIVEP